MVLGRAPIALLQQHAPPTQGAEIGEVVELQIHEAHAGLDSHVEPDGEPLIEDGVEFARIQRRYAPGVRWRPGEVELAAP